MTKIKEIAVDLLRDIPDDKMEPLTEILRGMRAIYAQDETATEHNAVPPAGMGVFHE